MSLLMGTLLFGMAAALIPLIIHLLFRQKATPLRWGAMQFLRTSVLQQRRRKWFENLLLMLLRMAALALLAFLLARPVWTPGARNPLAGEMGTDIALVVDRSLSTGRQADGKTIFAHEVELAQRIASAEMMRPSDTISVVLADHRPRALNPIPVRRQDAAALSEQLGRLKPGTSDCSIPDAIRTARDLANRGGNLRKLILVLGDGQQSGWKIGSSVAWRASEQLAGADKNLSVHAVTFPADPKLSNVSLGGIGVEPSVVGSGRPVQITAKVSNSGPQQFAAVRAQLIVDGKKADTSTISALAAGQSVNLRFDHVFAKPGSHAIRIETDVVDALAADNVAYAAVNVWPKLPVLIVDSPAASLTALRSSAFLEAALRPSEDAPVQPKVVGLSDVASVKLDDYLVVIVNDCPGLPPEFCQKLAEYARGGRGLWFIFGAASGTGYLRDDLAHSGLCSLEVKEHVNLKTPPGVEVTNAKNPMVALLSASQNDPMVGAAASQWWSVRPKDPDTQVVLAAAGGDPLVIERPIGRAGGRLVAWFTSVDGQWNNWATMPNFTPLVNETMFHLACGTSKGLDNGSLEGGEPIVWAQACKSPVEAVEVTLPDGTKASDRKPVSNGGRQEFHFAETYAPGIYHLRFTPESIAPGGVFYGVSPSRSELESPSLTEKDLAWLTKGGYLDADKPTVAADDLASILGRRDRGVELWKWLAAVVLLILVIETFMTWRMIRLQGSAGIMQGGFADARAA